MGMTAGGNCSTPSNKAPLPLSSTRGRITGYATVVGFFGHAVGESNEDLKALIGAASANFPARDFCCRLATAICSAGV